MLVLYSFEEHPNNDQQQKSNSNRMLQAVCHMDININRKQCLKFDVLLFHTTIIILLNPS